MLCLHAQRLTNFTAGRHSISQGAVAEDSQNAMESLRWPVEAQGLPGERQG
jgi:hypothetical protein